MKFVLNNEKVENSHGFYLMNKGGDFKRFNANPVMLYLHDQGKLIGRWSNLTIDGDTLVAEPVFDKDDELAVKLEKKVENNFLKGASPGIRILEAKLVEDAVHVTKWELMEASLVPVPSGSSSLALYSQEGKLLADSEIKDYINLCVNSQINTNTDNTMELKLFATQLGLKADASETEVLDAMKKVMGEKDSAEAKLTERDAEITRLQGELKATQDAKVKALIDGAIADKKIAENLRATYTKLAETDYEGCVAALAAMSGVKRVTGELGTGAPAGVPDAEKNWSYKDYVKNNKAEELKAKNFDRFKELYKLQYGREYTA